MHFSSAVTTFLAVSIASASPFKRTTASVLNDISVITTDVANLQAAISLFTTGTQAQANAIVAAENNLSAELTLATTDVATTATFDTADSTSVTVAITALVPRFVTALGTLIATEAVAATEGFNGEFETATSNLRTRTDAFFNALKTKLNAVGAAAVAAQQLALDTELSAAVAAF